MLYCKPSSAVLLIRNVVGLITHSERLNSIPSESSVCVLWQETSGTLMRKNKFKPFYQALFTTQRTIIFGRHWSSFSFMFINLRGSREWLGKERTKLSRITSKKSNLNQGGK